MHSRLRHAFSASLVVFAVVAAPSLATAQSVTVGPPGSGATYTSIQAGIDAAPAGGVVLVAAGSYTAPVTLSIDKPLTVLGAGSAVTSYVASMAGAAAPRLPLLVSDVPANGSVVVFGMTLESDAGFLLASPQAFVVQDCAGPVVLGDLVATGGNAPTPVDAAGVVRDSVNVMIERCDLGATSAGTALPLAPALLVERSLVHVNEGVLRGQSPSVSVVSDGAAGLVAVDATVRIARSRVRGGRGSRQLGVFLPTVATLGGAAIAASASQLYVRGGPGNLLRGGDGGIGQLGGVGLVGLGGPALYIDATSFGTTTPAVLAQSGLDGDLQMATTPPIDGPGVFAPLAFPLPTMVASDPLLAPGGTAEFALGGEPFAVCLPIAALRASTGFSLPGVLGLFALDPAGLVTLPVTSIDAAGAGVASLPVPPVATLVGTVVHAQLLSFGPGGWIVVSGPTAFAVR